MHYFNPSWPLHNKIHFCTLEVHIRSQNVFVGYCLECKIWFHFFPKGLNMVDRYTCRKHTSQETRVNHCTVLLCNGHTFVWLYKLLYLLPQCHRLPENNPELASLDCYPEVGQDQWSPQWNTSWTYNAWYANHQQVNTSVSATICGVVIQETRYNSFTVWMNYSWDMFLSERA